MKRLSIFLLLILTASCISCSNGFKEATYMGFNGEISTIEVSYYHNDLQENPWRVEVYSFDSNGFLKERLCYADFSKKILLEKDSYKRDEDGALVEEYMGFNLNDYYYIAESTWRRIEKDSKVEKWQKIENDWWGTSYKEISYTNGERHTKAYVITKKDEKEVNVSYTTQAFSSKGQLIVEKTVAENNPENIRTWTYDDNGNLVKVELEQRYEDGTSNKRVEYSFTINEVDDKNNPTLTTEAQGYIKTYKYTYR